MDIKTQQDWWKLLEINQTALEDLVARYHPRKFSLDAVPPAGPPLPITAPHAERMRLTVAEHIKELQGDVDPVQSFRAAVAAKDPDRLNTILNRTWFGIPESTAAHSLPGFGELCDLCSENWVFAGPDEPGQDTLIIDDNHPDTGNEWH